MSLARTKLRRSTASPREAAAAANASGRPPVRMACMLLNITTAHRVWCVTYAFGQGISQSADGARDGRIVHRAYRTRERDDEDYPSTIKPLTSKGRNACRSPVFGLPAKRALV